MTSQKRKTKWNLAADTIRGWIESGKYAPGSRLPPILELARMLDMTDQPIRKAVVELTEQKLIHTKNGVGIFVSDPSTNRTKIHILSSTPPGVAPDNRMAFITWEVYRGISQAAARKHIDASVYIIDDQKESTDHLLQQLTHGKNEGVIVLSDERRDTLASLGRAIGYHRMVSADFADAMCRYNRVVSDFSPAISTVLQQAYELGHRDFAMLYGRNVDNNWSHLERFRCFIEFCRTHDIGVTPDHIIPTAGNAIDGYRAAMTLLSREHFPSLIFAATDERAKGVIEAIKEKGLVPGRDVSVIGFDGMPGIAEWELCTIEIPRERIGEKSVELLERTMKSEEQDIAVRVEAIPVYRDSLGKKSPS